MSNYGAAHWVLDRCPGSGSGAIYILYRVKHRQRGVIREVLKLYTQEPAL